MEMMPRSQLNNNGLSAREALGENTSDAEVDRSVIKLALLGIFGTVFIGLFSYFLKLFLVSGDVGAVLFSVGAACFFLVAFLLQALFVKDFWWSVLMMGAECLGLFSGFYDRAGILLSITIFAVLLIFVSAYWNGKRELDNMLRVNFWKMSKTVLPKAISGLAIFISVSYVLMVNNGFFVSDNSFEKILAMNTKVIRQFYSDFSYSSSTREFVEATAKSEIASSPEAQKLPDSVKRQLINQSISGFENRIKSYLGSNFNFNTSISSALYQVSKDKFNLLPQSVKNYILLIVGIIIFLVITGLTFPIRIFVSIIAFFAFELLLSAGFAAIVLEGRSREIIILR